MVDFSQFFQPDNPVLAGGLGLGAVAFGAQGLRSAINFAKILIRRHLLVTLEVTSKDRSYPWVLQWLSVYGKRNQHVSVETSFKPIHNKDNHNVNLFELVPGPGQHFIWYNGLFIHVQRFREQQMLDLNSGKPWEKIVFTSISRDTKPFENILHESLLLACTKEEGKTTIFTNWGTEWRQFGNPRTRRALDSVILDEDISSTILSDVVEWKHSRSWYMNRGIPYRRGYLLHGPPGSGKSSFIMALAGHLDYNICILNMAERGMSDDRLALALSCVPPQSIVLLEDVDAAFPQRNPSSTQSSSSSPTSSSSSFYASNNPSSYTHMQSDVTFSGLLNVLDGVASSEERLLFMTTNHIDRLDPALIRPGRVDMVQLIGDATPYQIRKMFTKFYIHEYEDSTLSYSSIPNTTATNTTTTTTTITNTNAATTSVTKNQKVDEDSTSGVSPYLLSLQDQFVNKIQASGMKISMAKLQGHLMRYKTSPYEAIQHLDDDLLSHNNISGSNKNGNSNGNDNNNSSSDNSSNNSGNTSNSSRSSSSRSNSTSAILTSPPMNVDTTTTPLLSSNTSSSTMPNTIEIETKLLETDNNSESESMPNDNDQQQHVVRSKGRRVLSISEIDRMVFNPQPGWDKNIKSIGS